MRPEEFKFSRKKLNLMHPNVQQLIPSAVRSHKYVHQFIRLSQLQPLIPLSEASPLSQVPHLLHSHRYTRSVDTLADKYNCIGTLTGVQVQFVFICYISFMGPVAYRLCLFQGLPLIEFVTYGVCRSIQNGLSPLDPGLTCSLFQSGRATPNEETEPALPKGPARINTLWGLCIREHARMCIPDLDVLVDYPIDYKYPVFSPTSSGFFPADPVSLHTQPHPPR